MGDVSRALSLLDQLCRLLAAPPATAAAADRLYNLAENLEGTALCPSDLASDSSARDLASKLAALGDSLSRLAGDMIRADGQTGESAATSLPVALLVPLCGAVSIVNHECFRLAHVLGARLQRGDAYRLCAGLSFVLQVGAVLLRRFLQTMLSSASRQVPRVWLASAARQLEAVHICMHLAADHSHGLGGAWARTAGRPSAALPWLATMADLLVVAVESGEELGFANWGELAAVCGLLFSSEWSGEHAAALAAAPAVQAALMGLLLGHVLPSTAAILEDAPDSSGSGGDADDSISNAAVTSVNQMLGCEGVRFLPDALLGVSGGRRSGRADTVQLKRCVQRLGVAAVVQQAGRIALALPLQPFASPDAAPMPCLSQLREAHREAARLLACLCMAADEVLAAQSGAAEAAAASGGVPGSSSAASVGAERKELRLAMLQLTPHAAAVVQALAADPACTEDALTDIVNSYSVLFLHCFKLGRSLADAADSREERQDIVVVWAAALHACLQLLAFSLPRHEGWQRQGHGASRLPATLCMLWADTTHTLFNAAQGQLARQSPLRESPELLESMWALHSAACRTLHWLAQPQQQAALVHGLHNTVPLLLGGLHNLLASAYVATPHDDDCGVTPNRVVAVVRALSAAHWAALHAHPGAEAGGGGLDELGIHTQILSVGVLPEVADEPLAALLKTVLEPAHSAVEGDGYRLAKATLWTLTEMLWMHADAVKPVPVPLLARLAADGLPGRLAEHPDHPLASESLMVCAALLDTLWDVAAKLSAELEPEQPQQQQQQQEEQQQQQQEEQQQQQLGGRDLRHAVTKLGAALDGISVPLLRLKQQHLQPGEAASLAAAITRADRPAQRVAALLLQHCARPEQVAAERLAMAQAAAARSCANLRCANVELEGGPGAGKGRGCKRCSGCRAVFYCGTECSHADWRAGHRRTCAHLAAARQPSAARERPQSAPIPG